MNYTKFLRLITVSIFSVTLFFGCGGKTEKEPKEELYPTQKTEKPKNQIVLNSDDKMQFNLKEIKVKSGVEVTLKLNHTGSLPVNVMGHNFVLLKQGVDLVDFAESAASEVDNQYIPKDSQDVIAYTKMIGGGESASVTFTTPEKGTYDFLCSFPAHYAIMQGKFIVE